VDVTVVGHRCRPKEGVRVHKLSGIDDKDVRRKSGLWLTAPARTLIDLAADTSLDELERLVSEARIKGLLPKGELERALERAGRRRGTARMRAYLSAEEDEEYTRSKGERRMRQLLRAARLPMPRVNTRAAGYEIDFLWEEERVIVEVDGFRFHGHRRAFERDRRKDMALTAAGYLVIRLTWNQLKNEPFTVIAHIARALDRGARAAGAARPSG
jgi:very-short-patch-repair endonuclease